MTNNETIKSCIREVEKDMGTVDMKTKDGVIPCLWVTKADWDDFKQAIIR